MKKEQTELNTELLQNQSFLGDRFEFKYLLEPAQAILIEKYIRTIGLTADKNSHPKPYLVNSLYFDTPTLSDYRDKDGSVLIRKKMRARTYSENWSEDPKDIWLEIKKKRNMNINKSRTHINHDIWQYLLHQNNGANLKKPDLSQFSTKQQYDLEEFFYFYKRQLYTPAFIIKYYRSAYLSKFTNPIRITFDKNVVVCRASDPLGEKIMVPVTKNMVIMEVKFNHKLPWWFSDLVTRFDVKRDDFSKYRNSIAVLRGNYRIPINK